METVEDMEKAIPFTIQLVQANHLPFLEDMLYEAITFGVDKSSLDKEKVLSLPIHRQYLEGWGRPGDAGVIAMDGAGEPVGATWYRLYPAQAPGYGFISSTIPEISIGVLAAVRGRGIGRALFHALIALAQNQGYTALSLSVDRKNPALHLYESFGFCDTGLLSQEDPFMTMIRHLEKPDMPV